LDFDRRRHHGRGGTGDALCERLELPHGVTGVESCRSASPGVDSYRGDSCGSFEFLPNRRRHHKRRPSNLQEDSIQEVSDDLSDEISDDDDEKLFLPKRSGAAAAGRLQESVPGKKLSSVTEPDQVRFLGGDEHLNVVFNLSPFESF
jgi:hypothetical protein